MAVVQVVEELVLGPPQGREPAIGRWNRRLLLLPALHQLLVLENSSSRLVSL